MKGLVVTKDKEVYLEESLPIPEIGDYEALVKNECCMICNGTDLGVIEGQVREVDRYPAILGHEDAGRVVKVGKKVTTYHIGDLVVRAGQHNDGVYSSAWGGFAEYGVVKDYDAAVRDGAEVEDVELGITQQVCPIDMKSEEAAMLITLKEVYSALERIQAANNRTMVIVGDGPVALAFLCCGKLRGIKNIYVIGNHQEKLEVADRLGAAGTFLNKNPEEVEKARKQFARKVDICVDTIGANTTIGQCAEYVRNNGTIAVYGLKSDKILELTIPKIRNFTIHYVQWPIPAVEAKAHQPVVDAIINQKIDINAFITHRFPISEYKKGFQAVNDRSALKVVLSFNSN
ncbi:MAG: zinc-binding dehydrogenase [Faecalicatena sp.]|uniref:zinc-dependent alcohol dehydrogenase n=1 Tax=Faecalicatena sp. TaxID=2005360 RepID=UPI00258A9948|nr:zinc-binding dehydrogenase [Faecalicatena sp.]MCI6464663.1 zinc-binding dehydrogenase [Faecalicatena sp.]MDY5618241.1 zinc-binding dehydrogenase [Lachnospiraceae bacterium]